MFKNNRLKHRLCWLVLNVMFVTSLLAWMPAKNSAAAADRTPPYALSTSPVSGAYNIPIGNNIIIRFSEKVLPGPLASYNSISVQDAGGNPVAFVKNISNSTLVIDPIGFLRTGTYYTVTLPAGALKDRNGNRMRANYSFGFTTSSPVIDATATTDTVAPMTSITTTPDTTTQVSDNTPPVINDTDPANGSVNISAGKTITVNLSENVGTDTYYNNIIMQDTVGNLVSLTKSINGSMLTLDPINNLNSGVTYKITIPVGAVKDSSDNSIAADYSFSFTIIATQVSDNISPSITSSDPADGAVNLPVEKSIIVNFNEKILAGDYFNNILVQDSSGSTIAAANIIDGSSLTIDPVNNLNYSQTYTVFVPEDSLADVSGNAFSSNYTIRYTTVANSIPTVPDGTLMLEQLDIKGDGTNESATLQKALDYARDNRINTVVFPANKTIVVGEPIVVHENLIVNGNGCTIKLADNHPNMPNFVKLQENTQTRQLKIDGNKNNGNKGSNGVRLYSNTLFENNEVFNVSAYSIFPYAADNIKIINNTVHDSDQYGIATSGDEASNDYASDITISGNTIYDCKEVGIKLRWCTNTVVNQNTIRVPGASGDSASGIRLYSFDGPNSFVSITNNTITGYGTGGYAVGIESDNQNNANINIAGNTISTVYRGISISFPGATVAQNNISDCSWTGIWLVSNNANIESNVLNNAGIIVNTDQAGYNPSNNLIKGNTINGGNQYWRARDTGIYLWYTTTNNTIDGNQIKVNGNSITITDEFGKSTGTVITNNTLYSKTVCIDDHGIHTLLSDNQQLTSLA